MLRSIVLGDKGNIRAFVKYALQIRVILGVCIALARDNGVSIEKLTQAFIIIVMGITSDPRIIGATLISNIRLDMVCTLHCSKFTKECRIATNHNNTTMIWDYS